MERRVLLLVLAVTLAAPLAAAQGAFVVRAAPRFDVEPLTPEARIEPGREAVLSFRVTNRGNFTASAQAVFAEVPPAGEDARLLGRVEPREFALAPGESIDLRVRVVALADANDTQTVGILQLWNLPGSILLASRAVAVDVGGTAVRDATETPLLRAIREHPVAAAAIAAAVAGAGLLRALSRREAWRYAAVSGLLPLYTRLARSDVLSQERREGIHRLIAEEPGIHYSEIKRRTGLPAGVLVHHLRTLERHGFVASRREGRLRRFASTRAELPAPAPPPVTPMQQRVLDLLAAGPLTQRRIADALGLTPQGANLHVKALERRGLLAIRYEDGEYLCHAIKDAFPIRR